MLRVPQGCAEGPEGHDTLRPYPFAGGLTLVSPKRRGILPGFWGCPPHSKNSLESPFDKGGLRGFGGQRVDDGHEDGARGFRFALPTLHVDSRLRGNDKTGAAARCRGLGCPQIPLFSSPKSGGQGVQEELCIVSIMATEVQDASCRGFGGVPQFPLSPPKSGGQGVEKSLLGQPRQHSPVSTFSYRRGHGFERDFLIVPTSLDRAQEAEGKPSC
jgi:hypothetical protein